MRLKGVALWLALALLGVAGAGSIAGCMDVPTSLNSRSGCLAAGRLCTTSSSCCSGLHCLYIPNTDPALAECR